MKNNEYIRLGGVLLIITSVVALLLGFFNSKTASVIAEAEARKKQDSMSSVMEGAASFVPYDGELELTGPITELNLAYDDAGDLMGYCFTLVTRGYGRDITIMAGSNTEYTVTGVEIVSHSETAGLGANANTPAWLSQFAGKTQGLSVVKNLPQGNQIQAVTSATITSKAVTGAIDEALVFAQTLAEKED